MIPRLRAGVRPPTVEAARDERVDTGGDAWADPSRSRSAAAFSGVARIVQFNWPLYAVGSGAAAVALLVSRRLPVSAGLLSATLSAAAGLTGFWILSSLFASWLVYDRSVLMTGSWLARLLVPWPTSWVAISAGFDEIAPILRTLSPSSLGRLLDVYDPSVMSERSIARARAAARCVDAERADFAHLPLATASVEAVVLALSAHELRAPRARRAFFHELRRVLTPDGRVVVAEHLRDLANAVAFGPGVLHFYSRRTWVRLFTEAGFRISVEQSITPFVRVFVLNRER